MTSRRPRPLPSAHEIPLRARWTNSGTNMKRHGLVTVSQTHRARSTLSPSLLCARSFLSDLLEIAALTLFLASIACLCAAAVPDAPFVQVQMGGR